MAANRQGIAGAMSGRARPEVPKDALTGLVGMIRFGSGEKSVHVWFSLGNALAWSGHKHLALRALWQAERLGHPLTRDHAESIIRTVPTYQTKTGPMKWKALGARLGAEWAEGQKWVSGQQQKEEALLAAGKHKEVFGY